jgi:hypothetical protein
MLPAVIARATAILVSSSAATLLVFIWSAPAPSKVAEPPLWLADDPAGAKHSRPTLRFVISIAVERRHRPGLVISGQSVVQRHIAA